MTSLFHFEDKVHRKSLTRAESTPLLFLRLLCHVLEHIGFPNKPRLEHRHDREAILTVDQWRTMPHTFHLPPPEPAEDKPVVNLLTKEQLLGYGYNIQSSWNINAAEFIIFIP